MLKKKRIKTFASIILAAAMAVLAVNPIMGEEMTAEISGGILSTNPVEGGDSINDAVEVALGTEFTAASDKTSWYKFKIPKKGAVRLSGTYNGTGHDVEYSLCDNDKSLALPKARFQSTGGKQYSGYAYCNSGDYFYVGLDYAVVAHNETGFTYSLEFAEHIPWMSEWASKSNKDFDTADNLSINAIVMGYIVNNNNYNKDDFFKVTIPKDGNYFFNNAGNGAVYCTIYNSTRATYKEYFLLSTNNPEEVELSAGTYFVKLDYNLERKYKFSITDENWMEKGASVDITVGSDKYSVSCQTPISYNGTKHFPKSSKNNTKSKSYDMEITVMKNGELLPANTYSVALKNNKNASVSSDGVTAIGEISDSKKPYFTIKIKKAAKDVKNEFKKNKIYFDIAAADLTSDNVSYKKCKQKADGSVKLSGVSYKNGSGFMIKMKPLNKKGKGDYSASLISGNTIVHIEGKNSYCGSVDLPLK